jgi:hypothetical protein
MLYVIAYCGMEVSRHAWLTPRRICAWIPPEPGPVRTSRALLLHCRVPRQRTQQGHVGELGEACAYHSGDTQFDPTIFLANRIYQSIRNHPGIHGRRKHKCSNLGTDPWGAGPEHAVHLKRPVETSVCPRHALRVRKVFATSSVADEFCHRPEDQQPLRSFERPIERGGGGCGTHFRSRSLMLLMTEAIDSSSPSTPSDRSRAREIEVFTVE